MVKTGKAALALAGGAALGAVLTACGGQSPSPPAHHTRTVSHISRYEQGVTFGKQTGLSGEELRAGCSAMAFEHGYSRSWQQGCSAA